MGVMKFDLETPTVNDLKVLLPKSRNSMVGMAELLAKLAVDCPAEWGDPKAAKTYRDAPVRTVFAVAWKELGEVVSALDNTADGIEFDFSQATPEQYDRITRVIAENDIERTADILSQFVSKLPKGYGATDKKETYLKLRYYTQFRVIANALQRAGVADLENFLR